ncbi:MAG: hypothetical protein DLM53_02340 [Candidatus Eremiobacter antarcticus]|nr:hypothetical protein [Candidatus Eremiobacteraeota bacterium]MBC5808247.1 hypothetical protein [Candidatus Eremiobacteraeota bacterium]PZR63631.1 MAG: hypothetical protein DLM53_02340 [Candidatus Eremiobacter sp. RRmetagenome_bin22]
MEGFRAFMTAVASRSLVAVVLVAMCLFVFSHQTVAAVALLAGCSIGLLYLLHIARGFERLTRGGRKYLPFLTVESVLRVLLAGAAPFVIVGRGPWLGYFTYLAGFVAPLAVAIIVYKQQIVDGCADSRAAEPQA